MFDRQELVLGLADARGQSHALHFVTGGAAALETADRPETPEEERPIFIKNLNSFELLKS